VRRDGEDDSAGGRGGGGGCRREEAMGSALTPLIASQLRTSCKVSCASHAQSLDHTLDHFTSSISHEVADDPTVSSLVDCSSPNECVSCIATIPRTHPPL
jgi:hypothetical protein